MDQNLLRKVQLIQLEIAKEIKRVCNENNIQYFLTAGTLIGAIRHKGFIPWDDDLDIGMLREEYDRFCNIALTQLKSQYALHTWHSDSNYPLPFAKVCKKGTRYTEAKSTMNQDRGIYVDILIYDNAPIDFKEKIKLANKLKTLERMLLMKCKCRPWYENGHIVWKKRIGYIGYEALAAISSREKMVQNYETLVKSVGKSDMVYGQTGEKKLYYFKLEWFQKTKDVEFENVQFSIAVGYDAYLKICYGDYMTLPQENQRENRHQITQLDLGS